MTAVPVLTESEVSEYIRDLAENNHLIDGTEFSNTVIGISINLAISEYNSIPPLGYSDVYNFPSKAILMSGTLYKMFSGQAALLARNTMSYSDGGVQIPVEERAQLYQSLAATFEQDFMNSAKNLKIHLNLESGWGGVASDYSYMPIW